MSGQNKNREKEEKLFRALSGVDEELLLRSEHNDGGEKQKANGKIHRFPLHYASRIAAACLCLVVAGVLYMTMSDTKMADSTSSADTAAPQLAYSVTGDMAAQEENEASPAEIYEAAAEAVDTAEEADMPEGAVEEVMTDTDGTVTGNLQQAAQSSGSVASVSGNEAAAAGDSTETVKKEETLTKKQVRQLKRKMTTKGQ